MNISSQVKGHYQSIALPNLVSTGGLAAKNNTVYYVAKIQNDSVIIAFSANDNTIKTLYKNHNTDNAICLVECNNQYLIWYLFSEQKIWCFYITDIYTQKQGLL